MPRSVASSVDCRDVRVKYSKVNAENKSSKLSILALIHLTVQPISPILFVKKETECAALSDPRNAARIVRLHFHDCFVQGCDGSVLLDDKITLLGEKAASTNINSLEGFRIIDMIKNKIESDCPGIVSCADVLTIAGTYAVILVVVVQSIVVLDK